MRYPQVIYLGGAPMLGKTTAARILACRLGYSSISEEGYLSLEANLCDWAESRTKVGVFRVQAEATVRPRRKARPRRP
jgi:broad-specificity NMP kinase